MKVNTFFSSPPLGVVLSRNLDHEPFPICAMKLGGAVAPSCPLSSLQRNADAISNTQHKRSHLLLLCISWTRTGISSPNSAMQLSMCQTPPRSPSTVSRTHLLHVLFCRGTETWAVPRVPLGAAPECRGQESPGFGGCELGMSRGVAEQPQDVGGWSSRMSGSPGLPPAVPSPHDPAPPSSGRCRQQLHRLPAPPVLPRFPSAPAGWGWAAQPARGWAAGAAARRRSGRAGRRRRAAPRSTEGCSPGRSCGRSPWPARAPRRAAGSRSSAAPGRAAASRARWRRPWPGPERSCRAVSISPGPSSAAERAPVLPALLCSVLLRSSHVPWPHDLECEWKWTLTQNSQGPGLHFHWLSKKVPVICTISFPPWLSRFCHSESCWHGQSADPAGRAVAQHSTAQCRPCLTEAQATGGTKPFWGHPELLRSSQNNN